MDALTEGQLGKVRQLLFTEPEPKESPSSIFAIADGIRDEAIYGKLIFPGAEYLPLIDDEIFGYKESAPPFLIKLNPKPDKLWQSTTDYLLQHQIGRQTTLFLQSSVALPALHAHPQSYLYPFEEQSEGYLRFYDPHLFPVWVKPLTQEEAETLFCSIECFWLVVLGAAKLGDVRLIDGLIIDGILDLLCYIDLYSCPGDTFNVI